MPDAIPSLDQLSRGLRRAQVTVLLGAVLLAGATVAFARVRERGAEPLDLEETVRVQRLSIARSQRLHSPERSNFPWHIYGDDRNEAYATLYVGDDTAFGARAHPTGVACYPAHAGEFRLRLGGLYLASDPEGCSWGAHTYQASLQAEDGDCCLGLLGGGAQSILIRTQEADLDGGVVHRLAIYCGVDIEWGDLCPGVSLLIDEKGSPSMRLIDGDGSRRQVAPLPERR